MECLDGCEFFATTRTDNVSMIRILHALDIARVGKPYPRRNEQLVLFLRVVPDLRGAGVRRLAKDKEAR